ncbi:MAG: hypothetical protein ABS81_11560 [Pseudonocardia sp. SCN 72-86]|nr:MAG: hypothetical protein ABS81_11560 [Pseudonocardia sp. SCN 72-86]
MATAVSRLTGFVRTSVWAAALGLYTVGSAFTVANTVPTILFTLIAGGVLSSVLVPQLVREFGHSESAGRLYADRLISVTIVVLAPLTIASIVAAPAIVRLYAGAGWTDDDIALAAAFASWCLPQVLFYGLFAVLGQVLHARDRPGPMMWAPVANNVVAIAIGAGFLWSGAVDRGPGGGASGSVSWVDAALLGGGATVGVVAQVVVVLVALRSTRFRYRPRLDLRHTGFDRTVRLAGWTLLFVVANQIAFAVTSAVANSAGQAALATGSWAAGLPTYVNANMIMLVPHAVVAVSLSAAALPSMSRDSATGRADLVGAALALQLVRAGRILLPTAVLMLVAGPLIARLVFPGNPAADAWYIGVVLGAFSPAVVLYSAQFILARGLQAMADTRSPALVQLAVASVQSATAIVAFVAMPAQWVVMGTAAGFSVAYGVGVALTARTIRRATGVSPFAAHHHDYLRSATAAVLAGGAGAVVTTSLPVSSGLVESAIRSALVVAVFGSVWTATLKLLPPARSADSNMPTPTPPVDASPPTEPIRAVQQHTLLLDPPTMPLQLFTPTTPTRGRRETPLDQPR